MNLKLFFDLETTGLPNWKEPSGGDNQPHIVQLAAKLVDIDERKVLRKMDVIVKPEGWIIPQETIDLHGITMDKANEEGIDEIDALTDFLELWEGVPRVAHNTTFDNRIVRIATKRYCDDIMIDAWHEGSYECTGLLSKPIMKMEPKNRYGYKMPKLIEAYKFFTGKDLEGAHNAMVDVDACIEVYYGILDHNSNAA